MADSPLDGMRGRHPRGAVTDFAHQVAGALPQLRNYALRLVNSNRADADDLLQATFLRAVENRGAYVDRGKLLGWLSTTMFHVFANNRRRAKCRGEVDIAEWQESAVMYHPYEVDMTLRRVVAFIGTGLTPGRAEVLTMEALGFDYSEIAQVAGVPLGTVKSRISRARSALRQHFGDHPL